MQSLNHELSRRNEELIRQQASSEFEKQQLRHQLNRVEELHDKINQLHGSETDFQESIKRQAELEL